MAQDSGPGSKKQSELSAAAARILDEVKAEPIPQPILQLAQDLDRTLRKEKARRSGD